MKNPEKSERLNLRLSVKDVQRLNDLVELSMAGSATEVIRRALAVYEHLWSAKVSGAEVTIKGEDGTQKELYLL